jgi:hypothetical protein
MRCCITGHTNGLGKALYQHFESKGWTMQGFSNSNGFDLIADYSSIVEMIDGADLFINNAYANNMQNDYMMVLASRVKNQIVCGSVAGDFPDPNMLEYSNNKNLLEKNFLAMSDRYNMLLLKLTSSSYKDTDTVCRMIDFWLENKSVVSVTFNIED